MRRAGTRRFLRGCEGTSAVEFALVIPVFLLVLFGTIEFSRLLWISHALHQTAIAAARCMGIPQIECSDDGGAYSEALTTDFAEEKLSGWLVSPAQSSISLDANNTCHDLEGFSAVTISHRFETVLPKLVLALAGGTDLQASACFSNQSG